MKHRRNKEKLNEAELNRYTKKYFKIFVRKTINEYEDYKILYIMNNSKLEQH